MSAMNQPIVGGQRGRTSAPGGLVPHAQMAPDRLPIDADRDARAATLLKSSISRAAIDVPVATQVVMP